MANAAQTARAARIDFDPESHIYRVWGLIKPSVTQVLGAIGARVTTDEGSFFRTFFDYSFLPDYSADVAKTRGRWVADLIAYRLKQADKPMRVWSLSERQLEKLATSESYPGILGAAWLPYYDCFERWYCGRRDLKTIFVEKPLYDPGMDCCGSPDWFGTMDGKYTIIDWKTGIASPDTRYQTAAYEMLVSNEWAWLLPNGSRDWEKPPFIHRAALELHNDGTDAKLIMYPVADAANDRGVFLAARRVYQVQVEGLR